MSTDAPFPLHERHDMQALIARIEKDDEEGLAAARASGVGTVTAVWSPDHGSHYAHRRATIRPTRSGPVFVKCDHCPDYVVSNLYVDRDGQPVDRAFAGTRLSRTAPQMKFKTKEHRCS